MHGDSVNRSIREKLHADLRALSTAVAGCRSCPGGGKGIAGAGDAGADLFLLAGMPGPGAAAGNPWGNWRGQLLAKVCGEWGWDAEGAYFSTALRCRLPKVTRREVRRCAPFLADEIFLVGPRLVVVSGKVAAVALREALGGEIPDNPRAGDTCSLYATTFLFELDVARVEKEKDAAETFWHILRRVEEILAVRAAP
ncbi:MAG: uracil-DNA glycosylase family protein [Actinomycetota bacterium]|nr:uracil-DNA glycosylase family protein [Actinomycetota bacterium]MDD5667782.1 uracil-DNA glycosylase family protein [Actinomycetota bacterium]